MQMKPSFLPRLINDPFSDPGVYIPFLYEKKALLFDMGDLTPLSAKDLLKISHVFVSHTHMDHFIGFDKLLRIFLGREKELFFFGPPGFFDNVEGKLKGYTWNLVEEYEYSLVLKVSEIHEKEILTRNYLCGEGFRYHGTEKREIRSGTIYKEPRFTVKADFFDHRIPCIGFSVEENFSVNIINEELEKLGLDAGPWLSKFKDALYKKIPGDTDFYVTKEENGEIQEQRKFVLGDLSDKIARITPGQKITYITDTAGSEESRKKIIRLAEGSDHLFIEAAFMEEDALTAKEKYHLTTTQAGQFAKEAGVKKLTLFHFSPRYSHMQDELIKEAMDSFKS